MHLYSMLSQMYEAADRFMEKYHLPEDYPAWAEAQIKEREMNFAYNLLNDEIVADNYKV